MLEFTMKVSPETMINQADEIKGSVDRIRQQFAMIEECVRRSSGYWEGEASNLHTTSFAKIKESCDVITRCLSEHPDDLLKMAGLYIDSETKSIEESNSLQNNIIL